MRGDGVRMRGVPSFFFITPSFILALLQNLVLRGKSLSGIGGVSSLD